MTSVSKKKAPKLKLSKAVSDINAGIEITDNDFLDFYVLERYLSMNTLCSDTRFLAEEQIYNFGLKILNASNYAVFGELDKHAIDGGYTDGVEDEEDCERLGETNLFAIEEKGISFRKLKYCLDYDLCIWMYEELDWNSNYGGEAWSAIAIATKELYNALEKFHNRSDKDIKKVILALDHIIDISHNTDVMLQDFYRATDIFDTMFIKDKSDVSWNNYESCLIADEWCEKLNVDKYCLGYYGDSSLQDFLNFKSYVKDIVLLECFCSREVKKITKKGSRASKSLVI